MTDEAKTDEEYQYPDNALMRALTDPFAPEMLREHPSKGITYVPGAEVIARLNRVLGPFGWSYEVRDRWSDGTVEAAGGTYPKWVMARVVLTILPMLPDRDGNPRFPETSRTGVGGQEVKYRRDGGGPVDLGDEWKGAVTDALKKAAQGYGIGLDLARREEAILWEERECQPKDPETGARVAAALDLIPKEEDRKRAKRDYLRRFGLPGDLLAKEAAEAVAWVEVRTGTTLGEDETPVEEPPADTPADKNTEEPLATKAALKDLKASVEGLPADRQEAFKAWWRANVGVPMDDGVTIAQYEAAAAWVKDSTT